MSTTVFGVPGSPFVRKVLLALDIKHLPYALDPIIPMGVDADFQARSPLGKVPAFEDDLVAVADSSVICQYLEDRYPDMPLLPADLAARAHARFIEEYSDTRGVEVFGARLFFEKVLKPGFFKEPTDEALVADNLANGIPPVNDYLESVTPAQGFHLGDALGLVDISVGSQLVNAMVADYRVDAARWPKLAAWFDRFLSHELVARRLASEAEHMPKF